MTGLASEVRSEEQEPTVRAIVSQAELSLGGVGVTERGPIGTAEGPFDSAAAWMKVFGGYTNNALDSMAAVVGFFDNGGTRLFWTRVVHFTVAGDPTSKTSAKGTLNLLTGTTAPFAGSVTSAVQPYNMEPNQTIVVAIDGGADQTFTFAAAAASRTSGNNGPFALADNDTFQIAIDNGSTETKTFDDTEFANIAAATPQEVVNSLNAFFIAKGLQAIASVDGSAVKITSLRRGTGSGVNVVGGSANAIGKLNFTTGNQAGSGDVSNIDLVTAAEVQAKLAATITGATVTVVSSAVKITSNTTGGSSSVQVKNTSTATGVGFDNAVHNGGTGAAVPTMQVDGKTDGAYTSAVQIAVAAATSGEADEFNLYVLVSGSVRERFFNLSMDPTSSRYVETVVNDAATGSDYIAVTDLDASPVDYPALGTFGPLAGGSDGLVGLADADFTGGETANGATGFATFDSIDIDVLIVPGRATSAVHNAMITYCEITKLGKCFAILDPPANQNAAQMVTYVTQTASIHELSEYAAIYWPRVKVANPSTTIFGNASSIVVAPSGHIAGVYARSDARKVGGTFEQPAGIDYGVPRNVIGFETDEVRNKKKRELVFPKNINPISQEPGTPIFIDGSRCLKSTGNWPSVGQRRGVIFIEKRLEPGLAFVRHRNIKPKLYAQAQRSVSSFLGELTRADTFKSTDPKKAFFVDFGAALNTASAQKAKTVYGRIGLATSEPAEFVVLLIGPDTRELDRELAALAAA